MTNQFPKKSVTFDHARPAKIMSIDGTRCDDCYLIDISDTEAQIEATGQVAELTEFFLLLATFGNPVFRRCKRKWINGERIGISFNNNKIGIKSLEDEVRREADLVA